jgi:hypothetical protein
VLTEAAAHTVWAQVAPLPVLLHLMLKLRADAQQYNKHQLQGWLAESCSQTKAF